MNAEKFSRLFLQPLTSVLWDYWGWRWTLE